MKKILTLIFLLICVTAQSCMAGERIFQKFPGNMNINTVYISPIALKLGMNAFGGQLGEIKKFIKNPESIEVISTTTRSSHSALNQECKSVVQKNNMELILNCADNFTKTNIYIGKLLNDNEIQDIIIESQDGASYDVVYIKGIINAKELMKFYNDENSREIDSIAIDSVGDAHISYRKKRTPRSKRQAKHVASFDCPAVPVVPVIVERVDE